jgi:hypothetical protein
MIKNFNLTEIGSVFTNSSIEPIHNQRLIRKIIKEYETVHIPKVRTYAEVCYQFGFPVLNKNFSHMAYRARNLSVKNFVDRFRVVTGVSPFDFREGKSSLGRYALPLKYWFLALNYPIQSECCRILKKQPFKNIGATAIVGIMKIDSPERKKAINENNSLITKKVYPLGDWTKADIEEYCKVFNVEVSKQYKDRDIGNNTVVCASRSSGCDGCHYGQKDGYQIIKNGVREVNKV